MENSGSSYEEGISDDENYEMLQLAKVCWFIIYNMHRIYY